MASAGSATAEDLIARLGPIAFAYHTILRDLSISWRERRLADDLPLYLRNRLATLPDPVQQLASDALKKAKSRWWDTHPSLADRLDRIRKENAPGIFRIDAPSSVLFSDPKELCRLVTIRFYQRQFGKFLKPEHLYLTEEVSAKHEARREQHGSLFRYFRGLINPTRPIFPEQGLVIPADPNERAASLMTARSQLEQREAAAQAAAKSFHESDAALVRIMCARVLRDAGISFKPASLKFKTADDAELDALERQARLNIPKAKATLDTILRPQMRRMQTAIAMTAEVPASKDIPDDPDGYGEIELADEQLDQASRRLAAFRVLSQSMDSVERLRWRFVELDALLPHLRREGNPVVLVRQVIAASKPTYDAVVDVHKVLVTAEYPYEHTQKRASVSAFCCPKLPDPKKVRSVHLSAKMTLNGVYGLYMRLLADLSEQAEQAEKNLGLEPLPFEATVTVK